MLEVNSMLYGDAAMYGLPEEGIFLSVLEDSRLPTTKQG